MALEEFNNIAWRDFIIWAWQDDEVRAHFEHDTGTKFPGETPIDALIDDATDYSGTIAHRFVFWATKELWGIEEAPEKVRLAILETEE